jgi:ferredoxin
VVSVVQVTVDVERCCSAGRCAVLAPAVFDQSDDDGVVVLLDPKPPASLKEGVRSAARRCPAQAISIELEG